MTRRPILAGCTALVVVAGFAVLPFVLGKGAVHLGSEILLLLALAQMWNLAAGYAGLTSLGNQAYIGVGAYGLFFLSNTLGVSPYWVLPTAPLLGAAFAAVSTLLLLRLRDAYFVIGTWVLSEIVAILISKAGWLGGTSGLSLLTSSKINLVWFQSINYWLAEAIAVAAIGGSLLLLRSPIGLGLMGTRDNELAATSIGVDVWSSRFLVLVLAGAGCGLAGAVNYLGTLYVTVPSAFNIGWVGAMCFIVVVGGIGTLEGPILGTIVYFALREGFTALDITGSWYLATMGGIAALTMMFAPSGLWPLIAGRFRLEIFPVRLPLPARDPGYLPPAAAQPPK